MFPEDTGPPAELVTSVTLVMVAVSPDTFCPRLYSHS